MIVVMKPKARPSDIRKVIARVTDWGLDVHRSTGKSRMLLGVVGDLSNIPEGRLKKLAGVERIVYISERPASFPAQCLKKQKAMTVSIIGLGLLGGSVAKAVQKFAPQHSLAGFARKNRKVLSKMNLVGKIHSRPGDALKADLVILAMPVLAIAEFLKKHAGHFKKGSIITDLGSTKRVICKAARALPRGVHFVGGHPMAGKAVSGARHAEANLFLDRPWIFTPERGSSKRALNTLIRFAESLGAKTAVMTPDEHDRVLAHTSHLPQMLSTALALEGAELPQGDRAFMGTAYRDLTRLAQSSYPMWRDIALTNGDYLRDAMQSARTRLDCLAELVPEAGFEKEFKKAAAFRKRLS